MGEIEVGQIVCSKAGRDEGKCFIIWDIINESFVLVVDGKTRKTENPKKKNIKHLRILPRLTTEIAKGLTEGKSPSNAEVQKVIKDLGITQD